MIRDIANQLTAVDTQGLTITVMYYGFEKAGILIGNTFSIDGHGQPAQTNWPVVIKFLPGDESKAERLRNFLTGLGYHKVKINPAIRTYE